jgi:hypothetical protein
MGNRADVAFLDRMQPLGCFLHTILTRSTLDVTVNHSKAFLHTVAYVSLVVGIVIAFI